MNLLALLSPAGKTLGAARFFLVSYLPTFACTIFVLVLVWAGAPGPRLHFPRAWETATKLGAGELFLLWLTVTLVAVAASPMQLRLVRLFEGDWPAVLNPARRWFVRRQTSRRDRAYAETSIRAADGEKPSRAEVNRAGRATTRYDATFMPPELPVKPTALGNALAAMEYNAGAVHGLDAVVAWPRLYPLLSGETKAMVDDQRDTLDASVRLAATAAVTAVIAVALLARTDWWLLLALVPIALAVAAYRGSVYAAVTYGSGIATAIDLHRFDLHRALHVPLPATPAAERELNDALCLHWRQSNPHPDVTYEHPGPTNQPE